MTLSTPLAKKRFLMISFFLITAVIVFHLFQVFSIFISPILWAAILTIIFYPLYERILIKLKGRKSLSAIIVCFIVILMTAGPMVFFTGTLLRESTSFYMTFSRWIEGKTYLEFFQYFHETPIGTFWDHVLEKTSALNIELIPLLTNSFQAFSNMLIGEIQGGAKNFLVFVVNYLVIILILFFFIKDGASLGAKVREFIPLSQENKDHLISRLTSTVTAVVQGLVVTAVVQAVLSGIAFALLGVPFAILLSFTVLFFALVPLGGAVLIWFPACVYLFLNGFWIKGLILLVWGGGVVSTIDNFLKPILIGEKANLPTLFLFMAILGGIFSYGFIGAFIGPLLLALFLTLMEIYKKDFFFGE